MKTFMGLTTEKFKLFMNVESAPSLEKIKTQCIEAEAFEYAEIVRQEQSHREGRLEICTIGKAPAILDVSPALTEDEI